MSLAAINSCLPSKVFSNEKTKPLLIGGLASIALLCLTSALLGQFQVYSGLSLAGRITLFATAGAVALLALGLICFKPTDPLKNYLVRLGFPNATIQKTVKPSQLGENFEDHVVTVILDGRNDVVVFTDTIPKSGIKPRGFISFTYAFFEKRLGINAFLQKNIHDDAQIDLSQTKDWFQQTELMTNLFISEKFAKNLSFKISSLESIDLDFHKLHFTISDRPTNENFYSLINNHLLNFNQVLKSLFLTICDVLYQFPESHTQTT